MAATTIDELQILITAQNKQFQAALREVSAELSGMEGAAQKSSSGVAKAMQNVAKVTAVAFAAISTAVAAGMTASAKASWDQVKAVQEASTTLGRYYDSAEDVARVQQELIKYAQSDMGVLFNRKDLFAAASNLAMYGSSASDVSRQVAILSRGMASNVLTWDEMNAVVGRVISSGKLSRTEFEMLAKAGYNLDAELANTSVTADEFFDILDNSIPKDISQDMNNIVPVGVRLQTSFRNIGNAILGVNELQDGFFGGSMGDRIIKGMQGVTNIANDLAPTLRNIVTEGLKLADSIIGFLAPSFERLYRTIVDNVIPAFKAIIQSDLVHILGTLLVGAIIVVTEAFTFLLGLTAQIAEFVLVTTSIAEVALVMAAGFVTVTAAIQAWTAAKVALNGVLLLYQTSIAMGTTLTTLFTTSIVALATALAPMVITLGLLAAAYTLVKYAIESSNIAKHEAAIMAQQVQTAEEFEAQAVQGNNDAKARSLELIDELNGVKLTLADASLAVMAAEDREAAAQEKLNGMVAQGITSGREYERAELELESASLRVEEAKKREGDAVAGVDGKIREIDDQTWKYIATQKQQELAALAQAGKYDEVSGALKRMEGNSDSYKDASGNMVKISKKDAESMALFVGDSLSKAQTGYQKYWDRSGKSVDDAVKKAAQGRSGFESAGRGFSDGLSAGIDSNAWKVESSAISAARRANAAFNAELDIHSPSRVMKKSGGFFSDGVALGIESGISDVMKASRELARSANKSFGLADLGDVGFKSMESRADFMSDNLSGGDMRVVVNIGEERFIDHVVTGINNKSFLNNGNILNI